MSIPVQGAFVHGAGAEEERCRLHVVLAQVYPNTSTEGVIGDVLPKLAALTKEAAVHGADVIVFPEYFLTGATHGAWHSVQKCAALEGHDVAPWVSEVADIAKENNIAIVTGSAVQHRAFGTAEEPARGLYNTTYFLDRTGTVCGIYTKRNLWHAERPVLTAATDDSHPMDEQPSLFVFETARGFSVRASMVMCWDLMFPEAFRRMTAPPSEVTEYVDLDRPGQWIGPDVVFAPTCWFADDSGPEALAWNPKCESACLSTSHFLPRRDYRVPCHGERVLCADVQRGRPAAERIGPDRAWPLELQRAPARLRRARRA